MLKLFGLILLAVTVQFGAIGLLVYGIKKFMGKSVQNTKIPVYSDAVPAGESNLERAARKAAESLPPAFRKETDMDMKDEKIFISEENFQPSKEPEKKSEKLNSSVIMLLIGTAFIALSGIAFGVAGWVHTTPLGRIGIMLLASAIFFGASVFFRKVLKLSSTSTAFYTVGTILTSVTVITAGFYELLGSWFSLKGEGAGLLYASASLVTSALTMSAYYLYNKKAFSYIGISAVSAALLCLLAQVTEDFCGFAAAVIVAQAIITASINVFKVHKGNEFEKPISAVGNISSLIFAAISLCYVISSTFDPTVFTVAILMVVIAELTGYGIYLKKRWLISLQSLVDVYAVIVASAVINESSSFYTAVFFCAFCMIAVYFLNRVVPQLRTGFSQTVCLFSSFISALVCATVNDEEIQTSIIPLLLITAALFSYTFSKSKAVQVISGFFTPMCAVISTSFIAANIDTENDYTDFFSFGTLTLIMSIITAAIVFIPKYVPSFAEKYPVSTNALAYANMAVSACILCGFSDCTEYAVVFAVLCIIHFAVSNFLRNNICSAGSAMAVCLMIKELADELPHEKRGYAMLGLFVLLMIASRIFCRDGVISKTEKGVRFDTALIAGIIPMLMMLNINHAGFFFFMSLSIYLACTVKRKTSQDSASVILSISAFFAACALLNRPFFIFEDDMIASKITLGIIALLGAAYRLIWHNHKNGAKTASTIIFVLSFAGLIFDALRFQTAGNTIFVLAVTTGILLLSFAIKSKTWFTASSVALALITIYSTRKYLTTMSWWVYLFIAGLILIGAAAFNEYSKSKGKNIKETVSDKFDGWTW